MSGVELEAVPGPRPAPVASSTAITVSWRLSSEHNCTATYIRGDSLLIHSDHVMKSALDAVSCFWSVDHPLEFCLSWWPWTGINLNYHCKTYTVIVRQYESLQRCLPSPSDHDDCKWEGKLLQWVQVCLLNGEDTKFLYCCNSMMMMMMRWWSDKNIPKFGQYPNLWDLPLIANWKWDHPLLILIG